MQKKKGMIIASPSIDPPYKFHWVRDAALVMRVVISEYKLTKNDKYLITMFNYIENRSGEKDYDILIINSDAETNAKLSLSSFDLLIINLEFGTVY